MTERKEPVLQVKDITEYALKDTKMIPVIQDLSFSVYAGETVSIVCRTDLDRKILMALLSRERKPTVGAIRSKGKCSEMTEDTVLFPGMTVLENIELPAQMSPSGDGAFRESIMKTAEDIFGDKLDKDVSVLTGEETFIAKYLRIFMSSPGYVLIEEYPETEECMNAIRNTVRETGIPVIVLADTDDITETDRTIRLE